MVCLSGVHPKLRHEKWVQFSRGERMHNRNEAEYPMELKLDLHGNA